MGPLHSQQLNLHAHHLKQRHCVYIDVDNDDSDDIMYNDGITVGENISSSRNTSSTDVSEMNNLMSVSSFKTPAF